MEEKKSIFLARVRKTGPVSLIITVPQANADDLKLKPGDLVQVDLENKTKVE